MKELIFKFVNQNLSHEEKSSLLPQQKSEHASGFDLCSASKTDIELLPNERMLIPTGIAIALNAGFEGQVRSRSGLALKHGVVVLNSPGTIDADYRGEIKVLLANFSKSSFSISFGMRIAQLVIAKVEMPLPVEVDELVVTHRGASGFGSTGLVN